MGMVVLVLALAGCGAPAVRSEAPAPVTNASAELSRESYLRSVDSTLNQMVPGAKVPATAERIVEMGQRACELVGSQGQTQLSVIVYIISKTNWTWSASQSVESAATSHLCPTKSYIRSTVSTYLPAPAQPSATPSGPVASFGEGTFEVGVDIEAGKYKSVGSASGEGLVCYWERYKTGTDGEPGDAGYINELKHGPQVVTLTQGQTFSSNRCGTWTKR